MNWSHDTIAIVVSKYTNEILKMLETSETQICIMVLKQSNDNPYETDKVIADIISKLAVHGYKENINYIMIQIPNVKEFINA